MTVPKLVVLLVAAGLCLIAVGFLPSGQSFGQPAEDAATPTVAVPPPPPSAAAAPVVETTGSLPTTAPLRKKTPTSPIEQAGDAVEQAEPPGAEGSGMILVSKRPVEVLAGPSSSASTLYGFPAGRPFRVIGRDAGFAQIQDLKSGASGWIDEAALAPPPRVPTASVPSKPKPATRNRKATTPLADPKPKATKKDRGAIAETETVAAEPDPVQARKRRGLFGDGGLAGFLGGVFGAR